jgi:hypothetical protein
MVNVKVQVALEQNRMVSVKVQVALEQENRMVSMKVQVALEQERMYEWSPNSHSCSKLLSTCKCQHRANSI